MMKKTLLFLMLVLFAVEASATDGLFDRRKNRKRKNYTTEQQVTEKVVTKPTKVVKESPAAEPQVEEAPVEAPVENDITLNLTPEQVDSLLACWYQLR